MATTQTQTVAAGAVTAQLDFLEPGGKGGKLLSVRSVMPLGEALGQLLGSIASAQTAIEAAEATTHRGIVSGHQCVAPALELAHALTTAIHQEMTLGGGA